MRLRKFHRMLKKNNIIVTDVQSPKGTIGNLNSTNAVVGTKLTIPTTAFTGSAPAEAGIYVTGAYLIVGDRGTWISAALT